MDDYISREVLLSEIAADYGNWTVCNDTDESYRQGVKDNYDDTIRLINGIPGADVQPVKHGRWLDNGIVYTCSECNSSVPKNIFVIGCDFDGCPYCFARMDGDSDE